MRIARPALTYANVMATIAVFLSLAGTSYAAVVLASNSVRSTHIRNGNVLGADLATNAVTSIKVKNGSLLAADFKAGQLPAGAQGAQGPQGPQGAAGANGNNGANGINGVDATAPAGAVMFFNLAACPSGWSEMTDARGRYVVGLPPGGMLGGGAGTPLTNQEIRPVGQHNHDVILPSHNHTHAVGLLGSMTPIQVAAGAGAFVLAPGNSISINSGGNGTIASQNTGVSGTNAPYIQLLVCQKS